MRFCVGSTKIVFLNILVVICFQTSTINTKPQHPFKNKPFVGAGPTLAGILKSKIIRVGLQKDLHPFHISQPVKGFPGIDVELAKQLAAYLGVKVTFSYFTISELLQKVQDRKLDIAFGGISSNLERSPFVYFSRPYLQTTAGALMSKKALPRESDSIEYNPKRFRSLHDLSQAGILNIGVRSNTSNQSLLLKNSAFRKHKVTVFSTRQKLLLALKSGEIDVLVADAVYIQSLVKKDQSLQRRYKTLIQVYRPEYISIVVPRGDLTFKYEIDFFLEDLGRSGALQHLIDRYLVGDDWVPRQ